MGRGGEPEKTGTTKTKTKKNGKKKKLHTLAAAASIRLMLPSESALGSAGVPPIVETTRSTSSICANAFSTSSFEVASPRTTTAIILSISGRRTSERCSIQTQAPASLSLLATESATPPPPATSTEALSGSMSPTAVARAATKGEEEEEEEEARRGGEERRRDGGESGAGRDGGAGRRGLLLKKVSVFFFRFPFVLWERLSESRWGERNARGSILVVEGLRACAPARRG